MSVSDPSGLIGSIKEAFYGMSSMMESYKQSGQLELINALLADKNMPTMPDRGALLGEGSREQQFDNLKAAVLGKVREALALLGTKATPEGVLQKDDRHGGRKDRQRLQRGRVPGLWRRAGQRRRAGLPGPGEVAPAGLSFTRATALAGKSFERLHHVKNKEGGERVCTRTF